MSILCNMKVEMNGAFQVTQYAFECLPMYIGGMLVELTKFVDGERYIRMSA